jgi:hypothetical protein
VDRSAIKRVNECVSWHIIDYRRFIYSPFFTLAEDLRARWIRNILIKARAFSRTNTFAGVVENKIRWTEATFLTANFNVERTLIDTDTAASWLKGGTT